jgi:hypothetical protein
LNGVVPADISSPTSGKILLLLMATHSVCLKAGSETAVLNLPCNEPLELGFPDAISIPQNGYIYIRLSNDTYVWFDDLTVFRTGSSKLVQYEAILS